jgi:hypothetical protein
VAGGATGANPTASVGLTAVNGSAGTFMRSDAAPALSVSISPTWSGFHTFNNPPTLSGAAPALLFFENDQAGADENYWRIRAEGKVFRLELLDNALTTARTFITATRGTGIANTNVAFGNVTDNPTFQFNGTGLTTFNGGVVLGAPTGGNKGVGTINAASAIYINNVAVTAGAMPTGANPTNPVGVVATNGSATTFMRSDAAPAINVAIAPTWSGQHTFGQPVLIAAGTNALPGIAFSAEPSTGLYRAAAGAIGFGSQGATGAVMSRGALTLFGAATGVTNQTYIEFRDSSNNTQGYVGDIGGSDNHITLVNLVAGGNIVITAGSGGIINMGSAAQAPSFTTTSARAMKRETGAPRYAADILARLRPILYRLLVGSDNEQLGLVAEEVRDVCPQLSDGRTVAYDRLAILLLAAWQDEHAVAA